MTLRKTAADPVELPITLLRQLFEVSASTDARVRVVLDDFDITGSMAGVLWILDSESPPASMREIAGRLGCDPSNVTLVSNKLQRAGLVARLPHPSDGRARVLALTETGEALRKRLLAHLVAASPLPSLDSREQEQLSRILVKLGAAP